MQEKLNSSKVVPKQYKQKKSKRTISGKFLLSQLEEHYKDQPELAKELTKKVLENRVNIVKDEITRKIDK